MGFTLKIQIDPWRVKETNLFPCVLKQKLLTKKCPISLREEIQKFCEGEHDLIDQAIVMWRTYYFAIDNYRKNHPEWIFKKHEDLSVNTNRRVPQYIPTHIPRLFKSRA